MPRWLFWLLVLGFVTPACKKEEPRVAAVPEVLVATVMQRDVELFEDWVGTLEGFVSSDLRAKVKGHVKAIHYKEGARVKAGDLLFEIDPRDTTAALQQAQGELSKVEAQLKKAKQDVARLKPLVKSGAVSKREYDDAVQAYEAAKGLLETARGNFESAKLGLGYTKVISPVDGVAGIAQAQVGDLVGPGESKTLLATVSQLDPMKVYFPISEKLYIQYAELISTLESRGNEVGEGRLELVLADGSTYRRKGRAILADRNINTSTGTITIQALFANPENVLRPGQSVRVRAPIHAVKAALIIPQRAVTELQGVYQVAVVGGDNKVEIRAIKLGQRFGSYWLVAEGLKSGEVVVAEGLQKVNAGAVVSPKPAELPPLPDAGTSAAGATAPAVDAATHTAQAAAPQANAADAPTSDAPTQVSP